MPALPLALEPLPDEAWMSYLTRRAAQHHVTVSTLADHLDLRDSRARWPGHVGTIIDPATAARVAPALGLTTSAVHGMHLAKYDQTAFDLTGLTTPGSLRAIRKISARGWVHLSGSAFCPHCLRPDGVWQLRWRLPWSTTCPIHRVFLVSRCPACGHTPQTGNPLRGSAPARTTAPPNGRLCTYPKPGGDICGCDLTTTPTPTTSSEVLARDARFTTMLSSGHGTVAGADATALQTVRAWQSAIGLAVHLRVVHINEWGTHRGLQPPRDPQDMHRLLTAASQVIEAPGPSNAADMIEAWLTGAGIRSPHADTFTRTTPASAALRPVITEVLSRHGRTHTRIRRLDDLDGQTRIQIHDWTTDDVPQMVWPCALPTHLRASTHPDQQTLRGVLAMILVRMHGAGTWADAGAVLGIPAHKASNWTRHAFSSRFGIRQDLLDAATALSHRLAHQPARSAWVHRPEIAGYGVTALVRAQRPPCRCEDSTGIWCPCQDAPLNRDVTPGPPSTPGPRNRAVDHHSRPRRQSLHARRPAAADEKVP